MRNHHDTVPWPLLLDSEHDEEDRIAEQERETQAMGSLLIYAVLVVAWLAALVIVS